MAKGSECQEKNCLCNMATNKRQCGYSTMYLKSTVYCTKPYGHSDYHYSCGSMPMKWENETMLSHPEPEDKRA